MLKFIINIARKKSFSARSRFKSFVIFLNLKMLKLYINTSENPITDIGVTYILKQLELNS